MQGMWAILLALTSALWFASICYTLYGLAQVILSFSWTHFLLGVLLFGLATVLEVIVATLHG